jgi:membrane-bound lytic murein transglycosylase B
MGPAQFIPSTWMAYRDRAAAALGHPADPWNIRDAFVTSAIKLAAAGAASQDYDTEWKSAMIYYAGGNWNNPAYWPYANWIMDKAAEYQRDIDILEGR